MYNLHLAIFVTPAAGQIAWSFVYQSAIPKLENGYILIELLMFGIIYPLMCEMQNHFIVLKAKFIDFTMNILLIILTVITCAPGQQFVIVLGAGFINSGQLMFV